MTKSANPRVKPTREHTREHKGDIMRIVPRFAVTAAIALVMMCSPFARAQVLQSVPSEAVLVVKVKNIQDVSAKVAALSQQWGLANIRPELNDPLGPLLTAANLGPGLD